MNINKGFNSADYISFDVALHVRFGVDHIKIYMHTIPEDVFIYMCKYLLSYSKIQQWNP